MKIQARVQSTVFVLLSTLVASPLLAQIDVDIDLGKKEWYENPWVWAGVAVFLLLLALISRRRR